MLSSIISVKAILAVVALISVGSAAGVTAAPSIIHDLTATNANLTQAEQAAITYVNDHYPGNGTSKILKVENDTENGTAVFDIKVLAPNGTVYVNFSKYTGTISSLLVKNSTLNTACSITLVDRAALIRFLKKYGQSFIDSIALSILNLIDEF